MTDVQLLQRYELAAELCQGLRVLDLSDSPDDARGALRARAGELVGAAADEIPAGSFDAIVALDGLPAGERRERVLAELERRAGEGVRVLAVFERPAGQPKSPRVEPPPEDAAQALAKRLPGGVLLRQFLAEGAVILSANGNGRTALGLDLGDEDARNEDAAGLIVASGFDEEALEHARVNMGVVAAPVLLSYVRGLEAAHAELLRANRELMRERVGREGSAAASLLNAQNQLDKWRVIAREHEEHIKRVRAWYDAPRYHLADRVRAALTKTPGFSGLIGFLWSLISTRAETPQIDMEVHPTSYAKREEEATAESEAKEVGRERAGLTEEEATKEPEETSSLLEEAP
jgi:hypothetical protein